ncbi:response regulator [Phenylobacterium sp.]|uniref:response regulator n=1 Tax=Phenylobacterium sp. TaxID=1871053 RepID=UPI0025F576D8|nr:response regulator [Phenylobacterium sp.]
MLLNVLVIDDDRCVRAVIASTLTRLGYEVRMAEDSGRGVRLLDEAPADLVIVDISTPQVVSIDLVAMLKARHYPRKVVAVSGGGRFGGAEALRRAMNCGADAAFLKPLSMSAVAEIVGRLLEELDGELVRGRRTKPCRPPATPLRNPASTSTSRR